MYSFHLFRLHKGIQTERGRRLSASSITTKHSLVSALDDHPGRGTETEFMQQVVEEVLVSDLPSKQETTLDKLLLISSSNSSFEALKLKAYIRECFEVEHIEDDFPTGIHPDRYLEFVGGMCLYIIDKQGCGGLPYDVIFVSYRRFCIPSINYHCMCDFDGESFHSTLFKFFILSSLYFILGSSGAPCHACDLQ